MKKLYTLMLAFVIVFSLSACGSESKDTKPQDDVEKQTTEEGQDSEKDDKKDEKDAKEDASKTESISIGLVTDTGGIDDRSFNQGTWEGIQKFYEDKGFDIEKAGFLQSSAEADYVPNLSTYGDEGKDLIVAPGFLFSSAISEVAVNYPDNKFLLIDATLKEPLDNVASALFAEQEGSYLVGVVSALKAKEAGKNKVGFIGGGEFDVIYRFEAGFEQGVKAVDPEMEIDIEYINTFEDAPKAQTVAAKMYNNGCYIIFHAAGGAGAGLFKETIDRVKGGEDVWACGVDKDQYLDGIYDEESKKSVILTSMVKRVDAAAYDIADKVLKGEFEGKKVYLFDLKNEGVGLPLENPNLKEEWIKEANDYAKKIVDGEIKVSENPSRLEKDK